MDDTDLLIGAQLGDYQVVERIGEGGMGVVYRGFQRVLRKRVAIKVLKPEAASQPEQVRRLLDEAKSANTINHPGIVTIFGTGALPDGRPYLVMEYLEGQPLDQKLMDGGPLFLQEAVPLLKEICGALSAAHARGVVHRDLKPGNVFAMTQPDGRQLVKLVDFGLAKWGGEGGGARPKTGATTIVGTVEYMAPEQARAEPVTPRSDLYSLGVLAFELLTGQHPFPGRSAYEVIRQHLEAPPPAPSSRVDGVPAALDALVLQLMAKDPEQRPASADAVRAELTIIEREMEAATVRVPPGVAASFGNTTGPSDEASARHRRRLRLAIAAAVSMALALAGALAARSCAGSWRALRAPRAQGRAWRTSAADSAHPLWSPTASVRRPAPLPSYPRRALLFTTGRSRGRPRTGRSRAGRPPPRRPPAPGAGRGRGTRRSLG